MTLLFTPKTGPISSADCIERSRGKRVDFEWRNELGAGDKVDVIYEDKMAKQWLLGLI